MRKLPPYLAEHFRKQKLAALVIAGTERPVPRDFSDNMGAWPIRISVTQAWDDEIIRKLDSGSPIHPLGVFFRVWTVGIEGAKKLEREVELVCGLMYTNLRKSWLDAGNGFDPADFENTIHALARGINLKTMTDQECITFLEMLEQDRKASMKRRFMRARA